MAKRMIVVSDSHGDTESLQAAFEQAGREGRIDIAVFLGDGVGDFESVKPVLQQKGTVCYAVKGNNDWSSAETGEVLIRVNGANILACHGHTRYVKYGLERLWFAAREREANAVLYGHTHREKIDIEYGMYLINPGAVCERSSLRSAYAEVMIEDSGFVHARLVKWAK